MKKWIKDNYGQPYYGYTHYEIINGKKKKVKEQVFTIPSTAGKTLEVDLYRFLKLVEQAENKYGELRDIKVCWSFHEGSKGIGHYNADYDSGSTRFWITFERLESNEEEDLHEISDKKKSLETSKLLKKQLKE